MLKKIEAIKVAMMLEAEVKAEVKVAEVVVAVAAKVNKRLTRRG
jgi:hypothetical protein